MKKKIAGISLFIIGGLLIAERVIGIIIFYILTHDISAGNESLGVIGGADGPTAILVGTTSGGYSWITFVIGIILVVAGIIVIKKK